jgi:hypothetical protein
MPAWFLPLLGSKWTWIAVGVLVAITAALLYIAHVRNEGIAEGEAKVEVIVQQHTIQTQRKMDNAEAKGPRTQSDVVKRMRDGSF